MIDSDFLILFESILTPVKKQNISVTFSSRKYESPSYLVKEITKRIESIKKHSKIEGFDFFDDRVARLDDWSFNKNNDNGILRLHFSETSYYYFAAMNLGLDQPVTTLDNNKRYFHDKRNQFTLRHLLGERSNDLKNSILPNPLSVNMSVLLVSPSSKSGSKSNLKPKIILSKRSKSHTLEAQGTLSCLIGGTISIGEGDMDATGNPDCFKTVVRETKEELSLDLHDDFNDRLSRATVAEMCKLIEWPDYDQADAFRLNKVINEPDFLPLHVVRQLAQAATLVRVQRGKLVRNAVGQVHPKRCEARELTGRSISSRVLAHGPELLRTRVARVLAPGGRGGRALVTISLRQ